MLGGIKAWRSGAGCRTLSSVAVKNSSLDSSEISTVISASVGAKGGVNIPIDVLTIQRALNALPVRKGRPAPPLKEDSKVGKLTIKAIQEFQLKHFGWKIADGRVDPIGKTIDKINELLKHYRPTPLRTARFYYLRPQITSILLSSQRDLTRALGVVNMPTVPPNPTPPHNLQPNIIDTTLHNVNRHFDINKFAAMERKPVVLHVKRVMDDMLRAIRESEIPEHDLVEFNEVPEFETDGTAMYTYQGGLHSRGQTLPYFFGYELKKDRIYLTGETDYLSDEYFIYGLIHELAHFAGHIFEIDDHSYRHPDHPEMINLPKHLKPFNASSYSNFAFEAHYGRPVVIN